MFLTAIFKRDLLRVEKIFLQIQKMKAGHVFVINDLIYSCSKDNVYKVLNRLKKDNIINVAYKGIYYKIEYSEFLGGKPLPPDTMDVIKKIIEKNKEIIQLHGAEVANRFRISTQMPLTLVFLTSGYSREIDICGARVKFIHTSNKRLLQYPMHDIGRAIACLDYLGKNLVDDKVLEKISNHIGEENFNALKDSDIDLWMKKSIYKYQLNKKL